MYLVAKNSLYVLQVMPAISISFETLIQAHAKLTFFISWRYLIPKGSQLFPSLKSNGLFYVITSEALHKTKGTKKLKPRSFHQYSWNSEVETSWISWIHWPHKTSSQQPLMVQPLGFIIVQVPVTIHWLCSFFYSPNFMQCQIVETKCHQVVYFSI